MRTRVIAATHIGHIGHVWQLGLVRRVALVGLLVGAACGDVSNRGADAGPEAVVDAAAATDAFTDATPVPCRTPTAVGGVPNDTTKSGWGVFPGVVGVNDSGSAPGVFVVGDSLVVGVDPPTLANAIRFFHGTDGIVAAAGGASAAHFNKTSLISPAQLSTIEQYEVFFGMLRITVLALGSNDARIATSERDQTGGYSVAEFGHQVAVAVDAARLHSRCVLLVNVANHWSLAAPDIVDQVNGVLRCAETSDLRVRTLDWNAYSAPHPDWFADPTDIHHSAAGKDAYRDFITGAVGQALASGC
jgi:hypothetical protein